MGWFAVRSVIKFDDVFEERIVLFSAPGFDSALKRAETEAHEYAAEVGSGVVLDLHQAYALFQERIGDGTEVFSLMRTSDLDPQRYLSTYFDTGDELQQH